MTELRDLTDADGGTCDWGGCDDTAVACRATGDPGVPWLPVCQRHTERRAVRRSPGRGVCVGCGRDYALTVDGLVRLHGRGYDRCPGSGQKPRGAR